VQLNESIFTKEHLIPKSRGGNNTAYNLRPCCRRCNGHKGNLLPEEYLEHLKRYSSGYHNDIRIENTLYIIEYCKGAGLKLYRENYQDKNPVQRKITEPRPVIHRPKPIYNKVIYRNVVGGGSIRQFEP
jgi:hypothetical protein